MFDIFQQLVPNVMTLVVQLCATGVIYLLYRKYLHQPVIKILDQKADMFQKEYDEIETLKQAQKQALADFETEKIKNQELLVAMKQQQMLELQQLKQQMLDDVTKETRQLRKQAEIQLQQERAKMLYEVDQHVIEVASKMVEKVLDGYSVDEEQIITALKKEVPKQHAHS